MKILESTDERLVIGHETSFVDHKKLMNLQLLVNVFLTVCFLPIWINLDRYTQRDWTSKSFIFYFIISLMLVFVFYSGIKEGDYLFNLIFFSIPILGVSSLAMVAFSLVETSDSECLTFDKNLNFLTVKKFKFLFWNRSIKYPLNELLAASLSTMSVYVPSMNIINVDTVRMARRRRRDGKVVVFGVACGSDANFLVQKINTFLHE
jgi:hypothetical protein